MTLSLLHPPSHLSTQEALELSQLTPSILASNPRAISSNPLLSLFAAPETSELWMTYENLLISCLRTGDEQAAKECLERLTRRFGGDNERILAMQGLVKEADAKDTEELEDVLKWYGEILEGSNTNIPITKRRIALLRSLGRTTDAVAALKAMLEFLPVDAEAWSELAEIYLSQGLYSQTIYCLEEVLILTPNAWNMHARLGEVQYMLASLQSTGEAARREALAESIRRFCRSVELCDDYLRGHYGLKLCTLRLLSDPSKASRTSTGSALEVPSLSALQNLDRFATTKLSEIVRRGSSKERGWTGYEESELAAARELLSQEVLDQVR